MKKRLLCSFIVLLMAVMPMIGCNDLESRWYQECQSRGLTRAQAELGFYGFALRYWWGKKMENGTYAVNYSAVSADKIIEILSKAEQDVRGPFDDPKEQEFIKLLGLEKSIAEQQRAYKVILDNLRDHQMYAVLMDLLGENQFNGSVAEKKFDIKMLLPPEKPYRFTSEAVERAKEMGQLRLIHKFTFLFDDVLSGKEKDPMDLTEKNKFVWKRSSGGLEIRTYKIYSEDEKPADGNGDYIEAWRVSFVNSSDNTDPVMVKESSPCLRVFTSRYSTSLNIYVLDFDKENSEHGYGMPDLVKVFTAVTNGKDLLVNNSDVIKLLFEERPKEILSKDPPPMKVQIAKAGDAPPPSWEEAKTPEGYKVPFSYASRGRDNYTIEVQFEPQKKDPSGSPHGNKGGDRKIKYILKKWHDPKNPSAKGPGDVVEYYKPKASYGGNNIFNAEVTSGKEMSVTIKGQPKVSGFITDKDNIFIEDIPAQIDYTDGKKRWRIANLKGNDSTFESRQRVQSSSQTGMVSDGGNSTAVPAPDPDFLW